MSRNHFISRAVCINHPDATLRLAAMNERFTQQKIQVGLSPGVIPAPGEEAFVGAMRAHKNAILGAKKDGLDNILIFEDDVVFLKPWSWINRQLLDVPSDFDLIRLCIITDGVYIRKHVKNHIYRCWRGYGSQCYVVNAKCFDRILDFAETDMYDNLLCQSGFIEYAVHPLPLYHELGSSLAGNSWQQNRDDFAGGGLERDAACKILDDIFSQQRYVMNVQLRIIQALEVLKSSAHTQELRFLRSIIEKIEMSREETVKCVNALFALSLDEVNIPQD